jgi:uncharacterized protein
MRWQGRRESENVEDRRGSGGGRVMAGGGMGILVVALIVWALGGNPLQFLAQVQQQQGAGPAAGPGDGEAHVGTPEEEELKKFVSVVVADTEDVWDDLFQTQLKQRYQQPKTVIFSEMVRTGCGVASADVGPFYCPADQQVYLDLKFFNELKQRFNAPGDFAVAYVIAHEVGHHVQYLLGISEKVQAAQQQAGKIEGNRISVRLELQADFLAGVWAHHAQRTKQILESGDIEEAMNAASAVGDNAIQKQVTGHVVPDAFTHGSSEQRTYWFKRGFETGDLSIMNELFERDYDEL